MAASDTADAWPRLVVPPRPHNWRRRILVALAVALLAAFAVAGWAWFRSPRAVHPEELVRSIDAAEGGVVVPLSNVAPVMRAAVVDTEDERFWHDHGIDVIGVVRAFAYDLSHLTLHQGASTITEQLAKVLYLNGNDHSPWRKLEDAALALRLEGELSKDQILGAYLNTVYFGDGATGIASASSHYFGVPPSHLSLGQASLLAGLIQAPSADDPYRSPQSARLRQVEVLRSMIRNGDVTERQARIALSTALPLANGRELPPVQGADLSTSAQFSTLAVVIGAALVVLGASAWVIRKRRSFRLPIPWVAVGVLAPLVGAIVLVGSVRMD